MRQMMFYSWIIFSKGGRDCEVSYLRDSILNVELLIKIIVGDQRGILQLISIRKGEHCVDFKVDVGSAVNCVTILGSANGK